MYIQCFEFLQNEFSKFPVYTIFLFYYGKYIILAKEEAYYGTGMGALQECLRQCVSEDDKTAMPNFSKGSTTHGKAKTHNATLYTLCK
jgi:hypothetical protein